MRIGRLRHSVQLHHKTPNADTNDVGEKAVTYTKYATVFGSIDTMSGRELERAQQVSAEATHKVTIRYNDSVTVQDRVIHSNRILEIESIDNPEERNEQLFLLCKEIRT